MSPLRLLSEGVRWTHRQARLLDIDVLDVGYRVVVAHAAETHRALPMTSWDMHVRLDHVVVGTRDLAGAAAMISATLGVEPSSPQSFPALGFRRIMATPGPELEIIEVTDPPTAGRVAWTAALSRRVEEGECLIAWAVRVPDVRRIAAHLGMPVRKSGTFDTVGLTEAFDTGVLPFFISYHAAEEPPAVTTLPHLSAVHVSDPARRLLEVLGAQDTVQVHLVSGQPGLRAIEFATPNGPLLFSGLSG